MFIIRILALEQPRVSCEIPRQSVNPEHLMTEPSRQKAIKVYRVLQQSLFLIKVIEHLWIQEGSFFT